ncbi:hypothetical protein VB834_15265 [Limnoraphis robusta Tam1]|nr:hypothetical protein [Limnoraphis robusta]MEA5498360.1 hypothetical protein [Limnoraphis robusta BA-68 BA1]MEA5540384.1 hypothetical protein [Limnoraphis robusta Tam1]
MAARTRDLAEWSRARTCGPAVSAESKVRKRAKFVREMAEG